MDIFQSQRFRSSLKGLGDTTSRLARVMRTDARMRKNDYAEISRLNDRLKRTIPIIPAAFGISGAILGRGLDDGEFPGFFRFPGFGGPPILPPQGPGNPPQDPGPAPEQRTDPCPQPLLGHRQAPWCLSRLRPVPQPTARARPQR